MTNNIYGEGILAKEETIRTDIDQEEIIVPFDSYLPIRSESITDNGKRWGQPRGFDSFRVWVRNDTNRTMTVTIRYSRWWRTETYEFDVSPRSSKSYTVNDARTGTYSLGLRHLPVM